MKEYIVRIENSAIDEDEEFVGFIRRQPEVIRCKDCKHWKSVVHFDVAEYGLCTARTVLQTEPKNGFCHRAVRRDK